MNSRNIHNIFIYTFLLFSFFYATHLDARVLAFKVGDKASYTISQKLTGEIALFGETSDIDSEGTIDLAVEILSSNSETMAYPFEVQVTLKKILISETQHEEESSRIIKYDSTSLEKLENYILRTYIEKLIDYPLVFRVGKDFKIEELTNYLNQMYEDLDSSLEVSYFGLTPWTFQLFLTQLFHLSGESLESADEHPVSCYQFLNWEDREAVENEEISVAQTSVYTIRTIDAEKIKATWTGRAKVKCEKDNMIGKVSVMGNIEWNRSSPIIQKRDLAFKIHQQCYGFFSAYAKLSGQQTWQSH